MLSSLLQGIRSELTLRLGKSHAQPRNHQL
jgi:hypothetical protein